METRTDLFAALQAGDLDRVRTILEEHPDWADARNEQGDSLLRAAIYSGRGAIVDDLVRRGARVGLHEAAALGSARRVEELLDSDPGAVNAYSDDGWTPLHLAAFFGREDVARLLLDRGADLHARSRSTRFARENTALHAAAANRHTQVAALLLERGAEVNARDGHGFTPLALAAGARSDLLVVMLLERGAEV